MTHIVCRALTCLFWEQGVCGSEEIEYEPDAGCMAFQDLGDLVQGEESDDDMDWEDDADPRDEEDEEDVWEEEYAWDDEDMSH
jgi:hypothetical protein